MASSLTSSYQKFEIASVERYELKVSCGEGPGIEFKIEISSLINGNDFKAKDFEKGDIIKVKLNESGEIVSKLAFESVDFNYDKRYIFITSPNFTPDKISLDRFGLDQEDLSERELKVFHRSNNISLIKVGSKMIRIKDCLDKRIFYITQVTSEEIVAVCDENLNNEARYEILEISQLKKYIHSWQSSDLEIGDMLKIGYDSEDKSIKYRLILSNAELSISDNDYKFDINGDFLTSMKAHQLGKAVAYLYPSIKGLKVLHTEGRIRAFLYNGNITRLTYYSDISIIKMPKSSLSSAASISQPINQADETIKATYSYLGLSGTILDKTYSISIEDNQIVDIKEIRQHFKIQDVKFDLLSSVFSHARIFTGDKFGYLKAIGIGYLDHLCRNPHALDQFISDLRSNSGLYQLSLQNEDSRNILLYMLELLASERSINSVDEYYIHPDFMQAYLTELRNITYNKLQEEKVNSHVLSSYRDNKLEPSNYLRCMGNALGILIFTHSTYDTSPKPSKCVDYTFVMNIILRSQENKACLLYYKYLNREDDPEATAIDEYKCNGCGLLPHETYFFNISLDTCQRCYFDKKDKKGN